MTRQEILEKLKDILIMSDDRNRDSLGSCTEETKLATDLGLSSVTMLYLVISIEEEFGIVFDNVGAGDFNTLGDVIDFIEKELSKKQ